MLGNGRPVAWRRIQDKQSLKKAYALPGMPLSFTIAGDRVWPCILQPHCGQSRSEIKIAFYLYLSFPKFL